MMNIDFGLDYLKSLTTLHIYVEKRRYGKRVTIIDGFDKRDNLLEIARLLKRKLACGGTVKNGHIELQGNHKDRVKKYLEELGYEVEYGGKK